MMTESDNTAIGSSMAALVSSQRRKELGRRIYQAMTNKGWRQADLARASGLTRESVSSFINGKTWPRSESLAKLTSALGVTPQSLMPDSVGRNDSEAGSDFTFQVLPNNSSRALVRLNRVMSLQYAVKIADLVRADITDGE